MGSNGIPGAYLVVGTAPANATTYTDRTATGGTYSYRVVAFNAAGTSAESNALTIAQGPLAPTGLTATPNSNQVALRWVDNANNETSYRVLRNGTLIATLTANSTGYTNMSLLPGTTYTYTVQAVNSAGVSSSAPVSVTTLAASTITAPASLKAVVTSTTQINLAWTDLSTNERSFAVWRSVNGGAAAQVGTVSRSISQSGAAGVTVNYVDLGVSAGNTYTYYVTATSSTGQISSRSNSVSITTAAPVAPSGLTATAVNNGASDTVTLNWADNSNNETGFTIQRATDTAFTSGLNTVTVGANTTTTAQAGLSRARTYYFRVRATNAIGNSGWSNVRSVNTP
jgi:fibronectin type 3 domain-containing protein